MSEERKLPAPVTSADEYLYAIVLELRKLNSIFAQFATPARPEQTVELKEKKKKSE